MFLIWFRILLTATKMAAPYEILCAVKADANIPVTKYRARKTGIQVVIAEVDGPIVNGYFALGEFFHVFFVTIFLRNLFCNTFKVTLN